MPKTTAKESGAETQETDAKKATLAETVEELKEKFGEGAILTLGEVRKVDFRERHTRHAHSMAELAGRARRPD